jgi:SWI/SNF-related matrix-associated actin-dependent regulator of chromatin subfamily A containing DEAD/H box 1
MADSDPISDATPHKRRRLNTSNKAWDSDNDSGEDFTVADFETVPTLQVPPTQRRLAYSREQFHADLKQPSSQSHTYVTQPTQALGYVTQPTQPLYRPTQPTQLLDGVTQPTQALPSIEPSGNEVLVGRSSPSAASTPQKAPPQPIRNALFAKPQSFLASMMAPAGTQYRRPFGVQNKPPTTLPEVDFDNEPPLHHSSDDEESQGFRSNLRPTNFRRGNRGLDSTPDRDEQIVQESPQQPTLGCSFGPGFRDAFGYQPPSTSKSSNDMATAYGSTFRRPKPQMPPNRPRRRPSVNAVAIKTLDDISDYVIRSKVAEIHAVVSQESIQRCFDALFRCKQNVSDAQAWLLDDEERDAPGEDDVDELASTSPQPRRGVAMSSSNMSSSQPVRPAAKQEIKAPSKTIAEKYNGPTQAARRPSQYDEPSQKPRRRLVQGKQRHKSPTPPSSPPLQHDERPQIHHRPRAVIESSDEEDEVEEPSEEATHEQRLLTFFNECSIDDLVDLSAQPREVVQLVVDSRPFTSINQIKALTAPLAPTKTGKSRTKAIGEKVLESCSDALTSFDAIDELVEKCDTIAKPIREALKSWGVHGSEEGELQLTNLDEAHDSGIGTPASSCLSDDVIPQPTKKKAGSQFLRQPGSMNSDATLKDYQLVGLNWLSLMWTQRKSCILADDMGLGKTCQVVSFLAHLQEQETNGCALVIVPGSTLENWLREFQYFAPALTVQPYYGKQKERLELQAKIEADFDSIDVVVTTYEMAVTKEDNAFLRKVVDPLVCIFDEAHSLRNPKSQRYAALTRFKPEFRVLLTGTPLQNNLKELVAILAFIMPDLFRERKEELEFTFKHKATTKETENSALLSAQRITRARSMVTPFILRRKKHQVLQLPTKHSRIEYCDMTPAQDEHYANILEAAQKFFAAKASAKGKGSSKQSSNILMQLRKAAIHPLLGRRLFDDAKLERIAKLCVKHKYFQGSKDFDNPDRIFRYLSGEADHALNGNDLSLHKFCTDPPVPYLDKFKLKQKDWMDSGKVDVFKRLLADFTKNGDRVLVFSQFTMLMDILEEVLSTLNIKFFRLDGRTQVQVRQEMLDTFANDESISVFMLSTRAGGMGINLTAANKVIIFDSGFNPQDDIQAENRAHRVGQTKEVEVVRLITRGTIEEQIYAMGQSKLALDARVAGEEMGDSGAKAEKEGEKMLEEMLVNNLRSKEQQDHAETGGKQESDLKDLFKGGLESAGVKVASKQAQY